MNNSPILSLCIPTFNRCEFLKKQLNNIYKNLDKIKKKDLIEICISDNASSDKTLDVIKDFQNLFNIKININPENYGATVNIIKVLNLSTGKYFWLLGDDDEISDESVSYLLNLLQNNDYDVLHTKIVEEKNKNAFFPNYSEELFINKKNYIKFLKEDRAYCIGFLSSTIFKREFINLKRIPEEIIKTRFLQIFFVFFQITSINNAFLTKQIIHQKNSGSLYWSPDDWMIITFEKNIIFEYLKRNKILSKDIANYFTKNLLFSIPSLRTLLIYYLASDINLKKYKKFVNASLKQNNFNIYIFIYKVFIDLLTSFIFLPIKVIFKKIFHKKLKSIYINKENIKFHGIHRK